MTTIVYRDKKMCGDGQITRYECLIEATEFVKVMNIGNCLVGAAGNGMSIVKFFNWFADKVESEWAQAEYENLTVLPPEDLVEEDFQALVVNPEGQIFEYVGTKNVFPISSEYASIGNGCLYAYPLLDAGFSAKEAVEGAIKRCPFSGGLITEVTFDEEVEPLTEEAFDKMSKDEIKVLFFGEPATADEIVEEVESDTRVKSYDFEVNGYEYSILPTGLYSHANLNVYKDFGEYFKKGIDEDEPYTKDFAKVLNISFAPNIGIWKLIERIDEKVKEIQQSLIDNK